MKDEEEFLKELRDKLAAPSFWFRLRAKPEDKPKAIPLKDAEPMLREQIEAARQMVILRLCLLREKNRGSD